MNTNIRTIEELIQQFMRFPGVGYKTALRYVYKIIDMSIDEVQDITTSMINIKKIIKYCDICGNFADDNICKICKTRKHEIICVVKDPKDAIAIEKLHEFSGVYHILHGVLSPINNIGPNDINIKNLITRINSNTKEIIIATNPDVEGEATALYIGKMIQQFNIKVTRIAFGVPVGIDIDYADETSLSRALAERKIIEF